MQILQNNNMTYGNFNVNTDVTAHEITCREVFWCRCIGSSTTAACIWYKRW